MIIVYSKKCALAKMRSGRGPMHHQTYDVDKSNEQLARLPSRYLISTHWYCYASVHCLRSRNFTWVLEFIPLIPREGFEEDDFDILDSQRLHSYVCYLAIIHIFANPVNNQRKAYPFHLHYSYLSRCCLLLVATHVELLPCRYYIYYLPNESLILVQIPVINNVYKSLRMAVRCRLWSIRPFITSNSKAVVQIA